MFCNAPFGSFKCKDNKFAICCNDDYLINNTNNNNYLNNKLRNNIINGNIKNTHCEKCALKNLYNDLDEHEKNIVKKNIINFCSGVNDYNIFFADITLGHICNNDCMICQKQKDLYDKKNSLSEENINFILKNKNNITRCILIGGESFLYIDEMKYWISQFPKLKFLSIVTNGSIYNKEFISYLDSLNININITFSIDGTKDNNSYMRKKSNYKNIFLNLKKMSKYKNINFGFNVTVSVLNCLDIYNIINDIKENVKEINRDFYLNLSKLIYPYYYSIECIDDSNIKNQIKEIINKSYKDFNSVNFKINNDIGNISDEYPGNSRDMIRMNIKIYDLFYKEKCYNFLNKSILEYIYKE